ncbi:fatty acyl-CoA reductase 2, chloroplastic-like [Gastrolobium bilobum]|uniref:fatty acyl-CoA reductase 2, chloroplastic-like n=1 Tax=Gastrolobium bilobum TaxID=150636 RepID=UPI002AB0CF19|nr:fatty acyl-CoA reductase 2, chloroplastic-like [Gastrolobium bilobum]
MGAFSLSSSSIIPNKLNRVHGNNDWCPTKRKTNVVHCQGGGNVIKSSGLSSILTERPTLVSTDHTTTLMDPGSLVLSQNGKSQAEIVVKDLGTYGGPTSTTLVGLEDGIGIVKFLRGTKFFITGATGFLAKVLIEKILRTEPDVGKMYLLIKAENKEAAIERLQSEIINTELFRCLRQIHGKSYQAFMLSKLVPVVGNICESNLGLDEDSSDVIADEVDVIVNSAANTTFDERYDTAININTKGPCRLMGIAKKCKKLKLFLQVSTAYVNGQTHGRIMERPFSIEDCTVRENFMSEVSPKILPTLDIEGEINLVSNYKGNIEHNFLAQEMRELGLERARRYGWQDTYVFTKAMGEMMINKLREDIPVVIIRPSVIESTFREPFPGWMEGNRMMDPIVLCYGKGQLTGFLVDPNGVLDVVPADMVVNATLAAMARHGMTQKSDINVYQIASSVVNPLVFQDLARLLYEHYSSSPCIDSKGRPIQVPLMKLFSSTEEFSDHLWRDAIHKSGLTDMTHSKEVSQKLENICRKSVEQAKYLASIYEPYTFYGGRFDNSNTQRLMEGMSEEEKRKFGFDVKGIDWKNYITSVHIPGLRRHVMKGRGMGS